MSNTMVSREEEQIRKNITENEAKLKQLRIKHAREALEEAVKNKVDNETLGRTCNKFFAIVRFTNPKPKTPNTSNQPITQ